MRLAKYVPLLGLGLLVGVQACGDDEPVPLATFDLTFNGDASFQGPHGTQAISVALVRTDLRQLQPGTVSATTDPAFSFTFTDGLREGSTYEVHYWIDSNFMGGTVGVCDAPNDDHQWSVTVPAFSAAVTLTESHDATAVTDVCASFQ